ncbi:MAG: prolyl oligopeptidase family serine peptidase, partial [Bacteroidales bacterium]|nr:prolyl oligopeptidase family serine peptidase [Bacteroidales bacterium]
ASGPEEALLGAKASENPDLYNLLTPVYYIDKNDPPLIVFHGKEDNVVPCCQGQELYDHLKAAGVKTDLTLVDGGGHGMNMYSEANLQKMVYFLNAAKAARITNNGNVNGNGNANGHSKEKVNGNSGATNNSAKKPGSETSKGKQKAKKKK